MQVKLGRLTAILIAVFLTLPAASAAWSGYEDRGAEPSTNYDTEEYMFADANTDSTKQAYLNGYPSTYLTQPVPTFTESDNMVPPQLVQFNALLGFWTDCNGDGFIGNALTGTETYPVALLPSDTKCEAGDGHINAEGTGFVNEFLHIGPDYFTGGDEGEDEESEIPSVTSAISVEWDNDPRNVNDTGARVWADLSLPDAEPRQTSAVFPLPHGTLQSWEGHTEAVEQLTFNAAPEKVDETGEAAGLGWADVKAVAATLDDADVPTPLATVKNLYNSSTSASGGEADCGGDGEDACEGAYAQPLVKVFDCGNHNGEGAIIVPDPSGEVGDTYVAPPLAPVVNEDGTLDGTYYQLDRGLTASEEGCDDDAANLPYSNLERTTDMGVGNNLKEEHDVGFDYYPQSRIYEDPEGDHTVPYTGLVDGADVFAFGTPTARNLYARGWTADVVYLSLYTCALDNAPCVLGESYQPDVATFYAYVSEQGLEAVGASADTAFPGTTDEHKYGSEHCDSFDANDPSDEGWNCDPAAWADHIEDSPEWNVAVGQPYQLRDVDCYDNTLFGVQRPNVESPDSTLFEDFVNCEELAYE